MIQNTIFAFILLILIGCGAQNNPSDNKEGTLDISPENSRDMGLLPENIALDFTIKNIAFSTGLMVNTDSDTNLFKEDLAEINNIKDLAEYNRELLSQVMPEILESCVDVIRCHFPEGKFVVKENNKSVTLGEIDFTQEINGSNYQYKLTLSSPLQPHKKSDLNDSISYQWRETQLDVLTTYLYDEVKVSLRFVHDGYLKNMIVNSQKSEESSSFIINENNRTQHLYSNHIKKDLEKFSANILLENGELVEENENIFPLENLGENLKDGVYILVPKKLDTKALTLMQLLELNEGTFLRHKEVFQGFLYGEKYLNALDELTIIYIEL